MTVASAVARPVAQRFRRSYTRAEPVLFGLAGLLLFIGAWELAGQLRLANPLAISSPGRVWDAFQRQAVSGDLPRDLQATLLELAVALSLAVLVGLVIGLAMGLNRDLEYALDPFIWLLYSVPLIVFYPLLIVWLGFGFWTVVVIAFLMSAVPITVNSLAGLRAVDPVLSRTIRAFGGGRRDLIRLVILPASLPLILAGLRIAVGRALIGVLLGEMFSANVGLGFRLTYYGARLRTADVLVDVLLITLIGVILTQSLSLLESRAGRWRQR
jgi:ABC-type nitrate/sulfonate/bicarbonate transport system permease component